MRRGLRGAALLLGLLVLVPAGAVLSMRQGWHLTTRTPEELSAMLRPHDEILLPQGRGPFPAALLFHGCGGLRSHVREWGRHLRSLGFAAILVNSYPARGLDGESVCSGRALWGGERAGDVLASYRDALRLPFVDPDRVVLVGWSHGAWALAEALALDAASEAPPGLSRSPGRLDGVAGLVLFYPYCGFVTRSRWTPWTVHAPVLMLLAGRDSVVSPEECVELGEAQAATGVEIDTRVFPDAEHGFDSNGLPEDSPNRDPDAAVRARRRVDAFLEALR